MLTNTHIARELMHIRQLELAEMSGRPGRASRPLRRGRARRIRLARPATTRPARTGACVPATCIPR